MALVAFAAGAGAGAGAGAAMVAVVPVMAAVSEEAAEAVMAEVINAPCSEREKTVQYFQAKASELGCNHNLICVLGLFTQTWIGIV